MLLAASCPSVGMSFQKAVRVLEENFRVVRQVEFMYDGQDPCGRDWLLCLKREGIVLHFDRYSQRLSSIELRALKETPVKYSHETFR